MKNMKWNKRMAGLALILVGIAGCASSSNDTAVNVGAQCLFALPSPTSDSQAQAGEQSPGSIILPNGKLITPAGAQLKNFGVYPMNMAVTDDGKFLVITSIGKNTDLKLVSIRIKDDAGATLFQKVSEQVRSRPESFFYGLKVIPAPPPLDALYSYLVFAGGGLDKTSGSTVPGKAYIYGMDASGNLVVPSNPIPSYVPLDVGAFVGALELDFARGVLYAAYPTEGKVVAVQLNNPAFPIIASANVIKYPYDLQLSKDGGKLYVTNWGTRKLTDLPKVSVLDVSSVSSGQMPVVREITVGKNPEGMALSQDGKYLYVANSETDDVSVIDTSLGFVTRNISLRDNPDDPEGVKPTQVSISPDGKRLLVTSSGRNALDIFDLENGDAHLGGIPSGWWPTAALEVDGYWYILNGKGEGTGPNPNFEDIGKMLNGSLSQVKVTLDPVELATYTAQVRANNNRQLTFFNNSGLTCDPLQGAPIKHIVYILKENKTYDQVLGDIPGTNGDPTLCKYCCDLSRGNYCFTPNAHKLAEEFVNLDNFYSDAEVSLSGHMWNAASNITDYVAKTWMPGYRDDSWFALGGVEPTSYTKAGFIFDRLASLGIPFKEYGEIVGSFDIANGKPWPGVVLDSRWPPTFDLSIPDVDKVDVFIEQLQAGDFPPFVYMLLPNDHTAGCSAGAWHFESLVADNDAGLGKVVDAISHSPFWPETLIFVTEDDPQSGADHVDAHRTIGMVISPWVKKGTTISTHYSWPNFYKTMEVILGMPPMSTYDLAATPMYDIFSPVPDYSPYNMVPQEVPMVYVGQESAYPLMTQCSAAAALWSSRQNFAIPDQTTGIGKMVWELRNPGKPFPADLTASDNDEELREEAGKWTKMKQKLDNYMK